MKIRSLIASLVLALATTALAGRPSTDEMALQLGVAEWSRSQCAGVAGDIRIAWQGAQATTTFSLRPDAAVPLAQNAPVTLTWERRDGVWVVRREAERGLVTAKP